MIEQGAKTTEVKAGKPESRKTNLIDQAVVTPSWD